MPVNALYDSGRNAFLIGDVAWDTDNISMLMIDGTTTSYKHVSNQAVDDFLDDITEAGRITGADTDTTHFSGKTPTGGVSTGGIANANNVTFSAVSRTNSQVGDELIIYKYNSSEASAALLVNIVTATGLPVTPNSGDITVQWDTGTNKIFKL